jgi:hypothetical protein
VLASIRDICGQMEGKADVVASVDEVKLLAIQPNRK